MRGILRWYPSRDTATLHRRKGPAITPTSTPTTTSELYSRLRSAVLDLDLEPGRTLSERGLETDFGASRTPVRAVLARLESEGLVRRVDRVWSVTPIDLDEIRAVAELREAVECAAVRLACARASADATDELRTMLARLRPHKTDASGDAGDGEQHAVQSGTDFHTELARLSGNPFMVSSVEGSMTRLARTRWLEVRTPAAREKAWREHEAVVDLVAAGDADGAAAAVQAHIRGTTERLLATLAADRRVLGARGLRMVGAS